MSHESSQTQEKTVCTFAPFQRERIWTGGRRNERQCQALHLDLVTNPWASNVSSIWPRSPEQNSHFTQMILFSTQPQKTKKKKKKRTRLCDFRWFGLMKERTHKDFLFQHLIVFVFQVNINSISFSIIRLWCTCQFFNLDYVYKIQWQYKHLAVATEDDNQNWRVLSH